MKRVLAAILLLACCGRAVADTLTLKCPWQSGPNADLLTVDIEAKKFTRSVIDAGQNSIWSTPALDAAVSDTEVSATYNGTTYVLNRYTGALSSQFPSGMHTVIQCDKYERGAKKF